MHKSTRKLTKSSKYTYVLTIPKEIIRKYGWKEKQKLTVEDKGRGKVVIKDWPARYRKQSVADRKKVKKG